MKNDEAHKGQLSELASTIRSCQLCALATTRTNAVPGEGKHDAVVMFVGEGPGYDEDQQGRPFVGRSGQYLTEMMAEAGIQRGDVYITNVVKCRPPENRDPAPEELEACSDYLDRQVELINPRIIVTLGRFSMRRWFPGGSITRIHGQVRNIGRGRIALAMFHPAAALRNPEWRKAFAQDMGKLPPLIERARAADERAARGDALPAGVPHPGDPDFVEPATGASETTISATDTPDTLASVSKTPIETADERAPSSGSTPEGDDDDAQLSLW